MRLKNQQMSRKCYKEIKGYYKIRDRKRDSF